MTDQTAHIHHDRMQEYVDGTLPPGEQRAVLAHLDDCGTCRVAVSSLSRLDSALKHLPLERADERLTRMVMSRLDTGRQSDLAYRMISHAGGLVAVLFVAGIVVAVYSLTGVFDAQTASPGENLIGTWSGTVTNFISRAAGATGSLAGRVMPAIPNTGSGMVWVFGAMVLGILGGIDLLIQRKSGQRGLFPSLGPHRTRS
jgi:anti-sigma factor RsiW